MPVNIILFSFCCRDSKIAGLSGSSSYNGHSFCCSATARQSRQNEHSTRVHTLSIIDALPQQSTRRLRPSGCFSDDVIVTSNQHIRHLVSTKRRIILSRSAAQITSANSSACAAGTIPRQLFSGGVRPSFSSFHLQPIKGFAGGYPRR